MRCPSTNGQCKATPTRRGQLLHKPPCLRGGQGFTATLSEHANAIRRAVSYRAYALEYVENALDASLSHVPLNCDKCRVAYISYTTASWICLQKYTTLSVLGRKGEICHIA
jgi:hypothetical protein